MPGYCEIPLHIDVNEDQISELFSIIPPTEFTDKIIRAINADKRVIVNLTRVFHPITDAFAFEDVISTIKIPLTSQEITLIKDEITNKYAPYYVATGKFTAFESIVKPYNIVIATNPDGAGVIIYPEGAVIE